MNYPTTATVAIPRTPVPAEREAPTQGFIRRNQTLGLAGRQRRLRVRVLEGTLWITQEGDPDDHVLAAGDIFTSSRAGKIVLESLTETSRFVLGPLPT